MRTVIGIFPNVESDGKSSIAKTYVEAIENSGGMGITLPYTNKRQIIEKFIAMCDGFLFTGGADIDPCHYGEPKSPLTSGISAMRDEFELAAFALAYESKKPILAICRGCQLVNVALGGSLYQDIESEYKTDIRHRSETGNYSHSHTVTIKKDSPLFDMTGEERIPVNSMHHQAIKTLGEGLWVEAVSDDGIIEAVYVPEAKFLHAVQWHPERTLGDDSYSQRIFDAFVSLSKQ